MANEKGLSGLKVISFESRHAKTIADLVTLQGGEAISAPALKEVPLENNPDVFAFGEAWFRGEVHMLVLLTGVGTRALVEVLKTRYDESKIMEQLRKTMLVPRGPKPIRVLNEWKVPYAITVPEPNTWKELLKALDDASAGNGRDRFLLGRTVAVQEYGVPNPELTEGLERRGAHVMRVPVYRWALPDDTGPLQKAVLTITAGQVDVAIFTTAVQAEHLFQLARTMGRENALRDAFGKTVVASVGPDTSEALRQKGLEPDLEPESPKMGPLVTLTAQKAKDVLRKKRL